MAEDALLTAGLGTYVAAAATAVGGEIMGKRRNGAVMALLFAALLVHGATILLRWDRLGHGPYVDLFEVLSSNVWTLHAALLIGVALLARLRPILAVTLPVLQVLTVWLLTVPASDAAFPMRYETVWLPVHVWLGKVFLGIVVLALGLCLVVLLRRVRPAAFPGLPPADALDEAAFRLILLAFVFESLMLVAGAAWAQDAWGRYWVWDPLETWSFLTWLAVAGYLHVRATFHPRPAWSAAMVVGIFIIAFLTFFGIPFVSVSPHKGMI